MNKEQYLPWTYINGRPAVSNDLTKLNILSRAGKIRLTMTMKYGILDYKYQWI